MTVKAPERSQPQKTHENVEPQAPREPTADMVRDGLDALFAPPGSFERVDSSVQDIIGGRGQKVVKTSKQPTFGELARSGVKFNGTPQEGKSGQKVADRGVGKTNLFHGNPKLGRAVHAYGNLQKIVKSGEKAKWYGELAAFKEKKIKAGQVFDKKGYAHVTSPKAKPKAEAIKPPKLEARSPHDFDEKRPPAYEAHPLTRSLSYSLGDEPFSRYRYGFITY